MKPGSALRSAVRSALYSTFVACFLFCLSGLILDRTQGGDLLFAGHSFSRMVLGCIGVGLGFGLPACVYESDRLSLPLKTLIHMGIGCAVLIVIGFAVGWIPTGSGLRPMITALVGEVVLALLLWLVFYLRQKRLARRLNRRLEQIRQ